MMMGFRFPVLTLDHRDRCCILLLLLLNFSGSITSSIYVNGEGVPPIRLDSGDGSGGENVDKKAVLTRPLNQGIYQFQKDGHVPKTPLKRLRPVHAEMINTLRSVTSSEKLVKYLISIASTVNEDVETIRKKFDEAGIEPSGKLLNRKVVKADAFVFLAGHASLISHLVMYFPDVMRKLFMKNVKLDENSKWAIRWVEDAQLVDEDKTVEILNLAQQELGMIPRKPDFQNPYRLEELLKQEEQKKQQFSTTTTKKPRKRLQRGPRLVNSEL